MPDTIQILKTFKTLRENKGFGTAAGDNPPEPLRPF